MLRRLLFFIFVFFYSFGSFAQSFELSASQALNSSKDSLLISVFVRSTTVPQELGSSSIAISTDSAILDITSIALDSINTAFNTAPSYDPMEVGVGTDSTFIVLSVRPDLFPPVAPGNNVLTTPTFVARLRLLIKDKCVNSDIGWNGFPAGSVVGTYGGAFDTDPDTIALFSQAFLLRDSIGGTVNVVPASDTLCQGTDVLIELDIDGENGFVVDFTNGTDNYTVSNDGLDTSLYAINATLTGVQTFTITQITDTNGCVETTPGNFTDDDVFLDENVTAANAGVDDSICGFPRQVTLNGNVPLVGVGTWTQIASPLGGLTSFSPDANQANATASADSVEQYTYQWRIASALEGTITSGAACPADSDDVDIYFYREPTLPLVVTPIDTCLTGAPPFAIQLTGNVADSGSGVWTISTGPFGTFDDDTINNTNFNASAYGSYVLDWTISNGNCPSNTAQLQVLIEEQPSAAVINTADFSTCDPSFPISAQNPAVGTGLWITNPGGTATYDVATNNNTNANFPTYFADSTFLLIWRVDNTSIPGVCPTEFDTLLATRFNQPNTSRTIIGNATPNCSSTENYVLDATTSGSVYSWVLPDSTSITAVNVADSSDIDITFGDPAFPGNFVISEITDSGCVGAIDTFSFTPQSCTFTANFYINNEVSPDTAVCTGDLVTFVSNSAGVLDGVTRYDWDTAFAAPPFAPPFESTGIDDTVFQVTFNTPGIRVIQLIAEFPAVPDTIVRQLQVVDPPTADFLHIVSGPICPGDSVAYQIDINGGLPPFDITLDTGAGNIVLNNFNPGDTVWIQLFDSKTIDLIGLSDGLGCGAGAIGGDGPDAVTVNPIPDATLSLVSGAPFCTNDSVEMQINFTAGSGPFDFQIFQNGSPDTTITGASGPSFNFFVENDIIGANSFAIDSIIDANSCINLGPFLPLVNFNADPGIDTITAGGGDIICDGETDSITFTVSGGTANYTYYYELINSVSNSPFTFGYAPSSDSTITLDSVVDAAGCSYVLPSSTTTTVNPLPTATISGQAWICEGDVTPITFSGSLASDTIYYSANGVAQGTQIGPGAVPVSPVVTTNYTIDSVIDANGCQVIDPDANIIGNPVQVFVNPAITSATISNGSVICEGQTDSIVVDIVGGTGQYSLSLDTVTGGPWTLNNYNSGDSIPIITGATLTTTLLSVTDDSTCTYAIPTNTTTTVNPLATASISVAAGADTICSDGSSAADIEITLSGTGGPYDVTVSDGSTDTTFSGLIDGINSVQLSPSSGSAFDSVKYVIVDVFDNNSNCLVDSSSSNVTDTATFYLILPYSGVITPSRTTNDMCFGDNVTLNASNTTGYTSLQWLYGGNPIAGETTSSITVDYTGVFTLEAGISACVATSDTVAVQVAPPIDSVLSIIVGDSVFCENDSVLISVPSLKGNALGARTSTAFVQTTFDGIGGNAPRTLEAWILTDTAGGIMGYGNDGNGEAFVVRLNENGGQGNFGALKVQVKNGYITGTTDLTDSVPHHIAVVFDGDSLNDIRLYVDGLLEAPSSGINEVVNTNIVAGTAIDFRIGTPNLGPFIGLAQFGGRVDEVRFWDVALDQPCINNNKDIPLFGSEPGLVGLWNFEDTTGGNVKDLAGSNPGTLQPGATILTERGFYNPTVSYEWFEATGPTSVIGPGPDFFLWVTSSGDYYVDIDLNGNCFKTSDTLSLRESIQNPSIAAGGPTNLCFGDNVLLTATGQTALEDSTVWHFASNPIAGATTNTFTADASGGYSIVFYDNGCADTSNVIIVDVAAEIDTSLTITGDTVLCDGDSTILSVPLNGGNNLNGFAKPDVIRNVANPADVSFIHQTGKFTLQYWQKLSNPSQNNKINAALGNAFNGDAGFFAGYQRGSVGGLNVGAAPQIKMHLDPDGLNDFVYYTTEPGGIISNTDTNWHQLTLVVDSNDFTFYIDGTEITNTAVFNPITFAGAVIAPNELTIGDASSYSGGFGDLTNRGAVDEVRIWNIPLDSATIANNWNRPLNGNEPGLVALFDLDEDTSLNAGDNVNDLSVNAYTGTLNGGAIISNSTNSMPSDSLVYQWFRDGTPIAGATSNQLIVDTTGDYHVEISTADLLCTESSRTVDIDLFSVDPQVNVLTTNPACFGDTVQLQAVNNNGAIDSVRWFYGNYLIDSISNPYGATLSGNYTAVVYNNVCFDTSSIQTVDIKKAIDTSLYISGDSVLCVDDTLILAAPKFGSASMHISSGGNSIDGIGVPGDFDFVHQTGTFTTEFWVKLDNNGNRVHSIVGNANVSAEIGFNLALIVGVGGQGTLRLRWARGGSFTQYFSSPVTNAGNFDQWNHVAVSVENGNATFYFNGAPAGGGTGFTPVAGVSSNSLSIAGPGNNLIGKIDELRIWRSALTQAQINQNRLRPLNFNPDVLTAFSFDIDSTLGNGDTFNDNSGTYTATLNGTDVGSDFDNPFQPSAELSYQWYQDGSIIAGAIGDSLVINSNDFTDSAEYFVEIDNSLGCGPLASRIIKVKENLISDTLFASPTDFCFGTDSARIWVQLDVYDSVEIYNLQSLTPLASLTNTTDTFYASNTDTVYGVVYNSIDGKLCSQNTDTIIITAFVNPILDITRDTIIICYDSAAVLFSPDALDTIIEGSGTVNTYAWSPNYNLSDSTLLNAVYTANPDTVLPFILTITDDNGCIDSDTVVAETNPQIVVTLQADTTICFDTQLDLGNGSSINGGKAPGTFTYLWDNDTLFLNQADTSNLNAVINGDSAGVNNYGLLVTDVQTGCIGLDTVQVTVNDSIDFTALNLIDTICFNTPSIVIGGAPTAQGGSGVISTYAWTPATNLDDSTLANPTFINPSIAGTYTYNVIAIDNINCRDTSNNVTVEVAPEIIVDAGSDTVACFGDSTITIGGSPSASGGFGAFTYEWTTLGGTPSASTILDDINLPNPTIQYGAILPDSLFLIVTVSDSSSTGPSKTLCNNSDTIRIIFSPEIFADTGSVNFVCFDDTISLDGSASGGTNSGYIYAWGGQNQLLADTTDNTSLFDATIANSGVSGFYNLDLFAFDASYPQCFDSESFVFEVNDTLFADAGNDTLICYGQQVQLGGIIKGTDTTGSGGTGTLNYTWSGLTAFLSSTTDNNPIFNQGGITADSIYTYIVDIVDARGCQNRDTINIQVNDEIFVFAGTNDSICVNDSVILVGGTAATGGNGGFTFNWTSSIGNTLTLSTDENPLYTADLIGNDTLKVIATDSRGCFDSAEVYYEINPLPSIAFNTANNFYICRGEDTTLIAIGTPNNQAGNPLSYLWNNGVASATNIVSPNIDTIYVVDVTNTVTGCLNRDTVTIDVEPLPNNQITPDNGITTPDTVTVCSNINFVTLRTVNDSSSFVSNIWTVLDPPGSNISNPNNQAITIATSTIPPTGNFIENFYTDNNGCTNRDTVFLTTNSLPNVSFTSTDTIICFGDTVTFTASGGPPTALSYSFNRIAPSFANILTSSDTTVTFVPGVAAPAILINQPTILDYVVQITEISCTSEIPLSLTVNPRPALDSITNPVTDSVCFGQSIELSVLNTNPNPVPLDSFIWSHSIIDTSTVSINIFSDSMLSVTVYDTNGCSSSTSFDLKVKPLPDVSLDAVGPISICFGQDTLLSLVNPSSQYTYTWRDSSNLTVPPPGPVNGSSYTAGTSGDFFVEIVTTGSSSISQCRDTSNAISVTVNPLPAIALDTLPISSEFCFGDSVRLRETNSYPVAFYTWTEASLGTVATGTNFIYVSDSGQFKVIVTDANGCIDSSAVQEFFELPLSTDSILGDDTVCALSTTTYTSNTGNNGTWVLDQSFGVIQGGVLVGPNYVLNNANTASIDWATANNAQLFFTPDATLVDCPTEDTFDVVIVANPVAGIVGPNSGCVGDNLSFSPSNAGDTYSWTIATSFGNITNLVDSIILALDTQVPIGLGQDTASLQMIQTAATGCTDTATLLITKYDTVNADFLAPGQDTGVCQFDIDTFTVQNIKPGVNYTFNITSGAALLNNITNGQISIAWNFVGAATVRCIAVNGDCSDTVFHSFSIQTTPVDSFDYYIDNVLQTSPITSVCESTDSVTYRLRTPNFTNDFTWVLQSPGGAATALGPLDTTFLSIAINSAGSYILTMTEETGNGCSITLQETVVIDPVPTFNVQIFDTVICETDSIQIYSVTGNFDFNTLGWQVSNSSNMSVSNDPGNSQIIVDWGPPGINKWIVPNYSQGLCTVDGDTIYVDVEELPHPYITPNDSTFINGLDTTFCENLRTFFFANPADTGATYQWYNNGVAISNSDTSRIRITESGTYSFSIITSGSGCVDSTDIGVTANVLPIPDAEISGDNLWCGSGDSIELSSVNTASSYQWFIDSAFNALPNSNFRDYTVGTFGTYFVVLTNAGGNGCTDTSSAFVISPLAPAVSLFQFDSINSFCNNEIVPLNGNNAGRLLDFEWITNGQGQIVDPFTDTTTYIPSDLDSGAISFEFIVTNFCNEDISIDTADLRVSPDASYTPSSLVVELNETVIFNVDNEDATLYSWVFQPGATGSGPTGLHTYTQSGDFLSFLIAVNEYNCEDSFAVPIHVTRNQLIYVPNVFSPNATNPDNQVMRVYGTNISATQFEITIFNRWGIEVFKSTDLTEMKINGWNGSQNGNGPELPSGVYTYYIKGQFFDGEAFQQVGTVNLIK